VLRAWFAALGLALALAGIAAAQAQRPPQPAPAVEPAPSQPAPPAEPTEPAPPAATSPLMVDPRLQGPVPIRIVPNPKTEQELVAEQQERDQRSALESNLMLLVVMLVAIAFLQLVVTAAQGFFVWIGLSAMRRPMELAERNLAFAQRAFVTVGSLSARSTGQNLVVTPTLENGGATPTRGLRVSTNWRAWHGELPPDFSYNYTEPPIRMVLAARGRADIAAVEIPMRDVQAAIEDKIQLYVWGRATYDDVFEGSEPHFFEFCHRLDVTGAAPNTVAVVFAQHGAHNRTEQDSPRPAAERAAR
jgi:outer membrane biosynthesis protein TonB